MSDPRTPAEHYARANELLNSAANYAHNQHPEIAQSLVLVAEVHLKAAYFGRG